MASTPPANPFTAWGRRRAESTSSHGSSMLSDNRGRYRPHASSALPSFLPFYGRDEQQHPSDGRLSSSLASSGHREPVRSFINPAQRDNLAPVNSSQQARSVREDTAELASYRLADKAERRHSSILDRNRALALLRTGPAFDADTDLFEAPPSATTNASAGNWSSEPVSVSEPIEETSEPEPSPPLPDDTEPFADLQATDTTDTTDTTNAADAEDAGDVEDDEGPSLLTRALRRSPSQSPASSAGSQPQTALADREFGSAIFSDDEDDATVAPTPARQFYAEIPQPTSTDNVTCNSGTATASATETTPLLAAAPGAAVTASPPPVELPTHYDIEGQKANVQHRLRGLFAWNRGQGGGGVHSLKDRLQKTFRSVTHVKQWDRKRLWENAVVAPVSCLPAVIVGLLLNILDALSYGMILFPLGNPIFAHLGSAGISIFYVSTIVSQLIFSSSSIFKGGIGSELIEVVPFFHNMALTIVDIVGAENPDAVIATTITSYSLSAMVTGTVFYLMGRFRFGYIVGFIPRHILIGCIGGVGWFLVATGFEVTARIEGSLEYNFETLQKLFQGETVPLWVTPLALAIVLFWGQKRITNKYFLPLYILAIPFLFYLIALIAGSASPTALRHHGWVFQGPPAGEPWWFFYTLYQFDKVHWGAIAQCVPAMLALTFFGILHVPINVPALALNIGEDHADLNHELKLHGFSNFLSGCLGSIQNYLVYANTLFFIRSGGNSRLAGIELAFLTFGVMLIGPQTIGFIPVMMVGCLIFDLGFELLVEAIWLPRKKLKLLEYITVIVIVLIMGIYDFVVGIGIGILLAFVSLIFQASQISAVRAMYAGDIVNSTVRRNHSQHHFLRQVGRQICVIKVAGYLFFGTIVSVEQKIRHLIAEETFAQRPIRHLIIDLRQVTGLDYSAGEAFNTISRLLDSRGILLVLSGVDAEYGLGQDLRAVGLGEDGIEVAFLPDLNTALESCENELLKTFYASQEAQENALAQTGMVPCGGHGAATSQAAEAATPVSNSQLHPSTAESSRGGLVPSVDLLASSPRHKFLQAAAQASLNRLEDRRQPKWQNFSEPLRLMLQVFEDMSDKNEDFWFRATRYFVRREFRAGEQLFAAGDAADGFYLLEKGIIRAEYDLAHGHGYHESIVAGTTCGELPFFSDTTRTATAYAELDCVAWVLERNAWHRLQKDDPEVANELLRVSLKVTAERMTTVPSSTMLMAE